MSTGVKELKKGDILFREGDASDCMYVIKSGKIAITKSKGNSEIVLAELGHGDMLGEMAFFDDKPRSAGARALADSVVIALPFKALHAQFKTFPEWLRAIVKTVNTHLRNANIKIKNLEQASKETENPFNSHMITRLLGVLGLVGFRYGEKVDEGIVVPMGTLRRYTIQVFQLPTNKMTMLLGILQGMGYLKVEELGEGRQRLTVFKLTEILQTTDFYTDFLFKEESKRTPIDFKEMRPLRTLLFYSQKVEPNEKGFSRLNLTEIQNNSMRDLGYLSTVDDYNSLSEKNVVGERVSLDAGGVGLDVPRAELERIIPMWELIHTLLNYKD